MKPDPHASDVLLPQDVAAMRTLLATAGVSARQVIMEDFEIR